MRSKIIRIAKVVVLLALSFVLFDISQKFPAGSLGFWAFTLANIAAVFGAISIAFPSSNFRREDYDFSTLSPGALIAMGILVLLSTAGMLIGMIKLVLAINANTVDWELFLWFIPGILYMAAASMFRVRRN